MPSHRFRETRYFTTIALQAVSSDIVTAVEATVPIKTPLEQFAVKAIAGDQGARDWFVHQEQVSRIRATPNLTAEQRAAKTMEQDAAIAAMKESMKVFTTPTVNVFLDGNSLASHVESHIGSDAGVDEANAA